MNHRNDFKVYTSENESDSKNCEAVHVKLMIGG